MQIIQLPGDSEEVVKLLARPFLISLSIALVIQIAGNWKYRGLFPRTGVAWHHALLRISATISILFSLFGFAEASSIMPGIGFAFALINLVLGYSAPRGIRGPMLAAGWGSLGILAFGTFLAPAVST